MLTVAGLSKAYGGDVLFRKISFQVNPGDRIGLIGANGAGKSTLLEIIADLEQADAGEVGRSRGATLGYLPQESAPPRDETVLGMALQGVGSNHPSGREGVEDHEDPVRE